MIEEGGEGMVEVGRVGCKKEKESEQGVRFYVVGRHRESQTVESTKISFSLAQHTKYFANCFEHLSRYHHTSLWTPKSGRKMSKK